MPPYPAQYGHATIIRATAVAARTMITCVADALCAHNIPLTQSKSTDTGSYAAPYMPDSQTGNCSCATQPVAACATAAPSITAGWAACEV